MKRIIRNIILLIWLSSGAKGAIIDTTIQGVVIEFDAPFITAFPVEWQEAPISATAQPLSSTEIKRTQSVIESGLKKYPAAVLEANLRAIYIFKYMAFYNVGYGGTNSNDAVYLANNSIAMGYTDAYLEQTFHHEFSSILFRKYPAALDTIAWKKINLPDFEYKDPESGVGAIRNHQSSQELDTALSAQGFLTQYACSSLENDVNTMAQNLFKPSPGFWALTGRYPRIRKKLVLLIALYNTIDTHFTEEYFRKLNPE